mgnify:CR=1 FL=1
MTEPSEHQTFVEAWVSTVAKNATAEELVALFAEALEALWRRAHVTLGEVTLAAIVDRVVVDAGERHPIVTRVTIGATGPRLDDVLEEARGLAPDELTAAFGQLISEFLTVLGNLTAEILTPALHDTLSRIRPAAGALPERHQGEDAS